MKRQLVQRLIEKSHEVPAGLGGTITADILSGRFSVVQFGEGKNDDFLDLARRARRALDGAVLVKIDEVARLAALDETIDLLTMPTLMPPWPSFVMEYRETREFAFGKAHVTFDDPCDVAVLWTTAPIKYELDIPKWRPAAAATSCSIVTYLRPLQTMRTFGPLVNWIFYLGEKGEFLCPLREDEPRDAIPERGPRGVFCIATEYMDVLGEAAQLALEPPTFASALALALTHCKNVSVEEHQPSRGDRRRAEHGGPPAITYKTLTINPMRQILKEAAGPSGFSGGGLKRALHICRGHFARYSEERPLFGKIAGTFWHPQHVRGTPDRGAVVKDYVVKDE